MFSPKSVFSFNKSIYMPGFCHHICMHLMNLIRDVARTNGKRKKNVGMVNELLSISTITFIIIYN